MQTQSIDQISLFWKVSLWLTLTITTFKRQFTWKVPFFIIYIQSCKFGRSKCHTCIFATWKLRADNKLYPCILGHTKFLLSLARDEGGGKRVGKLCRKELFLKRAYMVKEYSIFWEGFRVLSDSNYASYFTTLIWLTENCENWRMLYHLLLFTLFSASFISLIVYLRGKVYRS